MTSYIYFTPATDVAEVNQIAEDNGYGPDSLSIELVNTVDNSDWYGTHSFVNLLQATPTLWQVPGVVVITEEYPDGEPVDNWNDALANNNLIQPVVEPL
jgi:hypothetical protein